MMYRLLNFSQGGFRTPSPIPIPLSFLRKSGGSRPSRSPHPMRGKKGGGAGRQPLMFAGWSVKGSKKNLQLQLPNTPWSDETHFHFLFFRRRGCTPMDNPEKTGRRRPLGLSGGMGPRGDCPLGSLEKHSFPPRRLTDRKTQLELPNTLAKRSARDRSREPRSEDPGTGPKVP